MEKKLKPFKMRIPESDSVEELVYFDPNTIGGQQYVTKHYSRKEIHHLIQPHAFKLGWVWASGNDIICTDEEYLFFGNDGFIGYDLKDYFDNPVIPYNEITPWEFLKLTENDVLEEPVKKTPYGNSNNTEILRFKDTQTRKCPHCNGLGYFVTDLGESTIPCPDCLGTGYIEVSDTKKPTWDQTFFELVDVISKITDDINTAVGAVIVDKNNRIVSMGYNGFPKGVEYKPERLTRENGEKYKWRVHAEQNAINFANKESLQDSKIYVSFFPCARCSQDIIQTGITTVIVDNKKHLDRMRDSKNSTTEIETQLTMFKESGVEVVFYER